ncbi:MAG: ACT domain-containing protein [Deltaproteobacteria bacterium]|nr:ACT domain-containing protein [Deltaproteobacteria bacterium]
MQRFKVFDILHHEHLCQITLTLTENNFLNDLFEQLEEMGVKIKFLVSHLGKDGILHITFCVEKTSLKTTQKILLQLPEVGMVAIHGPHFAEQSGIIDAMHHALTSQGLKVLAISTTVSTSFFVIPASEVVTAIDILKEAFEIPQGKI